MSNEVVNIFEDIGGEATNASETGDYTDIGRALLMVCSEIDEITEATFGSITLDTLLKIMRKHESSE